MLASIMVLGSAAMLIITVECDGASAMLSMDASYVVSMVTFAMLLLTSVIGVVGLLFVDLDKYHRTAYAMIASLVGMSLMWTVKSFLGPGVESDCVLIADMVASIGMAFVITGSLLGFALTLKFYNGDWKLVHLADGDAGDGTQSGDNLRAMFSLGGVSLDTVRIV